MKFSVIIPVYNAEETLPRCLDSLLAQSGNNIEIILVDDGSTDSSAEICKKYAYLHPEIKYLEKENGGVASALNYGIQHMTGDYFAWLSHDDVFCKIKSACIRIYHSCTAENT